MDTLDRYLESIASIPILPRSEQIEIGRALARARRRFTVAVALLPQTVPRLVERWRTLLDSGRSVEPLVEAFRGPGGAARARELQRRMARLAACGDGAPRRAPARLILGAGLAFPVLEELWREALGDEPVRGDERKVREHATRAHARYIELRARLARHNLRLVVAFAKRFRHRGVDFLDLIQEGNKALLRAVEKFDPERGLGFTSYATWWIEQALVRAVHAQADSVRRPTHAHQLRRAYLDRERMLRCTRQGEPSRDEVATALDVPVDRRRQLDATLASVMSADQPVGPSSPTTLGETLADAMQPAPSEEARVRELARVVAHQIASLPPRERHILEWRFGFFDDDEQSLEAIGQKLGITRERVRQIEKKALGRLRERTEVRALAREIGIELNDEEGEERDGCRETIGTVG